MLKNFEKRKEAFFLFYISIIQIFNQRFLLLRINLTKTQNIQKLKIFNQNFRILNMKHKI